MNSENKLVASDHQSPLLQSLDVGCETRRQNALVLISGGGLSQLLLSDSVIHQRISPPILLKVLLFLVNVP